MKKIKEKISIDVLSNWRLVMHINLHKAWRLVTRDNIFATRFAARRFSRFLTRHDFLIVYPRVLLYRFSLGLWMVDSRQRWASKKVRAGLSSHDYVSMHTYVSLTLAKTPHLPIKRHKVSRIDQPLNRETRDRGG